MLDLSLNSDFSIHLDDKNGLATVSGRDAFEQSLAVMLTDFMYSSAIGGLDSKGIVSKLKLEASRVAKSHDRVTDIQRIDVQQSEEKPSTFEVEIVYLSDANFNLEVSK